MVKVTLHYPIICEIATVVVGRMLVGITLLELRGSWQVD